MKRAEGVSFFPEFFENGYAKSFETLISMSKAQVVIDTKFQNAFFRKPSGRSFSIEKLRTTSF